MPSPPPDVVLLAAEWQPRALIRAQLIEAGYDVRAADSWPMMRRYLRPGAKPRIAFIDLKGLPDAPDVLRDVRVLMKPDRVLVLTAMGTASAEQIQQLGFRALSRPVAIDDVVRTLAEELRGGSRRRRS